MVWACDEEIELGKHTDSRKRWGDSTGKRPMKRDLEKGGMANWQSRVAAAATIPEEL